MTQDWILRGRDWLESCQNDDGGGAKNASYENPVFKGKATSTASQTSWAFMGFAPAAISIAPACSAACGTFLYATVRWRLGGATDTARVFRAPSIEVRHVPAKLPAARARDLHQLPQRARALSELLSLLIHSFPVCGAVRPVAGDLPIAINRMRAAVTRLRPTSPTSRQRCVPSSTSCCPLRK